MPKRESLASLIGSPSHVSETVEIDRHDLAIMRALADDSRHSQRSVARIVGLSPSSVAERIARLENLHVIEGYSLTLNWEALGYDTVVFMQIVLESGHDFEATLDAFRTIPELEELWIVTGQYDLLARFRLRGQSHLRELLLEQLWAIPSVVRIESVFGLGNMIVNQFPQRLLGAADE